MKYLMLGFLLGLFAVPAVSVAKLQSSQLKELVESKNSRVLAAQKNKEGAQEREGFFGRSFVPSLEMHASEENFKIGRGQSKQQPTYGAEVRMNLFNAGKDKLEGEVRQLNVQKKNFESQRILSEELEKVRTAYWQALYFRDKVELLGTALEVNKKNLSAADRRIRGGVATESDRMEFEMKAVELDRDLAEAKLHLASQRRSLKILLGLEALNETDLAEKMDHEHDYEAALKHGLKDHEFLFKETEIQSEQSRLQAKKEGRSLWPKLDVFASYNQYNEREKESPASEDRTETAVGLRMTMVLGAGLESQREKAALLKEAEASQYLAGFQKKEVEAHLENEMSELSLMHNQVHEAEENIKRAEKYYRLTQSEYTRGVKNSPDVLGASEKLFESRHKRLEIIRDFQLAKAHVLSKIGR